MHSSMQGGRVSVSDGYSVQLSIVNTKSDQTVFLDARIIALIYAVVEDSMMFSFSIFLISFAANCLAVGLAREGALCTGLIPSVVT